MQNNNTEIMLDDLQIAQVEALANYLPIKQVAGYFNLSASDFLDLQKKDKRVLRAYKKGKVRGLCKVTELLWQQMEAGNVTAIIFFLKTRGGWSERPFVETGDNALKFKELELDTASLPVGYPEQEEATEPSQSTDSKPVYTRSENIKEDKQETGRALEAIAKRAGVSHMTAFQYDAIQRKGTEEQKAEVASGNSSIKKVYTSIRKAKRLESNKVIVWPKFIPIPLGVMVTKEVTEVMARL